MLDFVISLFILCFCYFKMTEPILKQSNVDEVDESLGNLLSDVVEIPVSLIASPSACGLVKICDFQALSGCVRKQDRHILTVQH